MVGDTQLKVTFFPPLYLQRRIWVLDILRRERVSEIVDIGCGEGELLAVLCQPAPSLPPPGPGILASSSDAAIDPGDLDLHPIRIAGLDISTHALTSAVQDTSPASANSAYTRWEPLSVNIWHGGLEVFNATFVNIECIVATEVIEHLPEAVLADFAPMVLGAYHPRLLLITTPSYTFNARFSPPGMLKPSGFPDPTKRTDRVFRHHDHKFEWTIEEFREWCRGVACEWGYDVDMTTIGRAQEKDEWGRDEELEGASQVALFRRMDGEIWAAMREKNSAFVRNWSKSQTGHRLLAAHCYDAHVRAGMRMPAEEIVEAVVKQFGEWGETELRLEEIWFVEGIGMMCGGWLEVLIEAIEGSAKFNLQRSEAHRRGDWPVVLVGGGKKKTLEWSLQRTADDMDKAAQDECSDEVVFSWGKINGQLSPDSGIDLSWDVKKDDDDAWGKGDAWGKDATWTCHHDPSDITVDWSSHDNETWDIA